jgi:hypothetical protein
MNPTTAFHGLLGPGQQRSGTALQNLRCKTGRPSPTLGCHRIRLRESGVRGQVPQRLRPASPRALCAAGHSAADTNSTPDSGTTPRPFHWRLQADLDTRTTPTVTLAPTSLPHFRVNAFRTKLYSRVQIQGSAPTLLRNSSQTLGLTNRMMCCSAIEIKIRLKNTACR